MDAFSELVDPAHFEQVYDSVEEVWKRLNSFYETPMTRLDGKGWVAGTILTVSLNTTFYPSIRILWLTELRLRRKRGHADDIGLSYLTLTIF